MPVYAWMVAVAGQTCARASLCVMCPILHILEMHVCSRLALVFFHTRPSSVFFRAGLCALDLVASFLHATSGSASFVGRSHARTKCRSSRSSVPLHMSSAETPTNVLIIGSGPAGLLAAHHLLLKGVFMCRCVCERERERERERVCVCVRECV